MAAYHAQHSANLAAAATPRLDPCHECYVPSYILTPCRTCGLTYTIADDGTSEWVLPSDVLQFKEEGQKLLGTLTVSSEAIQANAHDTARKEVHKLVHEKDVGTEVVPHDTSSQAESGGLSKLRQQQQQILTQMETKMAGVMTLMEEEAAKNGSSSTFLAGVAGVVDAADTEDVLYAAGADNSTPGGAPVALAESTTPAVSVLPTAPRRSRWGWPRPRPRRMPKRGPAAAALAQPPPPL